AAAATAGAVNVTVYGNGTGVRCHADDTAGSAAASSIVSVVAAGATAAECPDISDIDIGVRTESYITGRETGASRSEAAHAGRLHAAGRQCSGCSRSGMCLHAQSIAIGLKEPAGQVDITTGAAIACN